MESSSSRTINALQKQNAIALDASDVLGRAITTISESKIEPALLALQNELKVCTFAPSKEDKDADPKKLLLEAIQDFIMNPAILKFFAFGSLATLLDSLKHNYDVVSIISGYLSVDDLSPYFVNKASEEKITTLLKTTRQGITEVLGKAHELVESELKTTLEGLIKNARIENPNLEKKYQAIKNDEQFQRAFQFFLNEGLLPALRLEEEFEPEEYARSLSGGILKIPPDYTVSTRVLEDTQQLGIYGAYHAYSSGFGGAAMRMVNYKGKILRDQICYTTPSEYRKKVRTNIEIQANIPSLPSDVFGAQEQKGLSVSDGSTQLLLKKLVTTTVPLPFSMPVDKDEVVFVIVREPSEFSDIIVCDKDRAVPTTTFNSARRAPCKQFIHGGDKNVSGRASQYMIILPWEKGFKSRIVGVAVGVYHSAISKTTNGELLIYKEKISNSYDRATLITNMQEESKSTGIEVPINPKNLALIEKLLSGKEPIIKIDNFSVFENSWGISPFILANIEELESTELFCITMPLPIKISGNDRHSIEQFRQMVQIDYQRVVLQEYKLRCQQLVNKMSRMSDYKRLEAKLDNAIANMIAIYKKDASDDLSVEIMVPDKSMKRGKIYIAKNGDYAFINQDGRIKKGNLLLLEKHASTIKLWNEKLSNFTDGVKDTRKIFHMILATETVESQDSEGFVINTLHTVSLSLELEKANQELEAAKHEFFVFLAQLQKAASLSHTRAVVPCSARSDLTMTDMNDLYGKQLLGQCIQYIRHRKDAAKLEVKKATSTLNAHGIRIVDITTTDDPFARIKKIFKLTQDELLYCWANETLKNLTANVAAHETVDTLFRSVRALNLDGAEPSLPVVSFGSDSAPVAVDKESRAGGPKCKTRYAFLSRPR